MSNMLEYKGYHTKVLFDVDSRILHGKVEGIRDFVNFETSNPADVEKEFHEAVDDYLAFCDEVGKSPDKEYKGTFNVRINPTLHRELAMEADKKDVSMNQLVENAIDDYLHRDNIPTKTVVYIKANESKSTSAAQAFSINYPANDFFNQDLTVKNYA